MDDKPQKYNNVSESRDSQRLAIDIVKDTLPKSFAAEMAKSFSSQQSAVDIARAAIPKSFAAEMAKSFSSQRSAIDIVRETLPKSFVAEMAKSFGFQRSAIDIIREAIPKSFAAEMAKSHNYQQSIIGRAKKATISPLTLESVAVQFAEASNLLLIEPDYLPELTISTLKVDISNLEEELSQSSEQFKNVKDVKTFVEVFNGLPPIVQGILYFLLINIFLPQFNSISANLLTPIVETYLEENTTSERNKIKAIKNIPLSMVSINTDNLRFITGNNVRLRIEPSTNSEILDELVLGQVVTIVSKHRNWIEVMYKYEGSGSISGWVFTRYTAKFVK